MKLIVLFSFFGFFIATYFALPTNIENKQIQDPVVQTATLPQDSTWFEKHLDLYIEEQLFTFAPTKYTQAPTPEVKKELLLDCWLGSFTISDMTSDSNLITVNCSNEEQGFNKFIYITPDYLLVTLYTTSENGMQSGSSIIYYSEQNKLESLEGIMITKVAGNILGGSRENYSDTDGYIVEYGHYNVAKKKFAVESTE